MKKISVIVPVYNGEDYISRCVDSILNQQGFDVNDLEILLLDDGSRDGSFKILKKYAEDHPKIVKALTHKNMGVAKTRDKGMGLVTAEYVMFVDQDDYIDSDYCATLYDASQTGDYDVVICGFKRPGSGLRIINKNVKLKDTPYAKYVCTGVFPKIHRTEFIKKSGIHAFHTVYGEDIGFILHEYATTKKIKVVENYAGYNWYYNAESVSNTLHKRMTDVLDMHLEMLDKIKSYDTKTAEHEYYTLQTIVAYLLWAGRSAKPSEFMHAYKQVFSWLHKNHPHVNRNKYLPFGPSGAPMLSRLSIGGIMFLHRCGIVSLFAALYCRGR